MNVFNTWAEHPRFSFHNSGVVLDQNECLRCLIAGHKRPPAAQKLVLLKSVARIQSSVKTKSLLCGFRGAVQLGHHVPAYRAHGMVYSASACLQARLIFVCVSAMRRRIKTFSHTVSPALFVSCKAAILHVLSSVIIRFSVIRLHLSGECWYLNPTVTPLSLCQLTPQAVHKESIVSASCSIIL